MTQQIVITDDLVEELQHAEERIERVMKNAFVDFGRELKHIRERKLYLLHYENFNDYVLQRWEITPARATQLIQASDVYAELTKLTVVNTELTTVNLPSRERHIRPLLKLQDPNHRAEVWQRVIRSTNGNNITSQIVEQEVERKIAELEKDWITVEDWEKLEQAEQNRLLTQIHLGKKTMNQVNENIEWALWSWNPVTGCKHGCDYCYARDIANRFYPQGFEPSIIPSRLSAPQNTTVPMPRWEDDIGYKGVFVCSMADLFGKWVPEEWIQAVIDVAWNNPQWNFLFLTKFPIRMAEFEYPSNAWLGTSVDKQWAVDRAERGFRKIKDSGFGGICWLSCEPMLERLTFNSLDMSYMFDWVVIGGSSKSTQTDEYKPPFDDIVHLHLQARDAGLKIYHKTNLLERLREYPFIE